MKVNHTLMGIKLKKNDFDSIKINQKEKIRGKCLSPPNNKWSEETWPFGSLKSSCLPSTKMSARLQPSLTSSFGHDFLFFSLSPFHCSPPIKTQKIRHRRRTDRSSSGVHRFSHRRRRSARAESWTERWVFHSQGKVSKRDQPTGEG